MVNKIFYFIIIILTFLSCKNVSEPENNNLKNEIIVIDTLFQGVENMAYDPAYNKSTWSNEEQITSTKLNQMVDNTDHNYKYKAALCNNASGQIKIARGIKSITGDGTNGLNFTVTYATDCIDGDPGFANNPVILITFESYTGNVRRMSEHCVLPNTTTKASFTAQIKFDSTTSDAHKIHWVAIGA